MEIKTFHPTCHFCWHLANPEHVNTRSTCSKETSHRITTMGIIVLTSSVCAAGEEFLSTTVTLWLFRCQSIIETGLPSLTWQWRLKRDMNNCKLTLTAFGKWQWHTENTGRFSRPPTLSSTKGLWHFEVKVDRFAVLNNTYRYLYKHKTNCSCSVFGLISTCIYSDVSPSAPKIFHLEQMLHLLSH